MTDSETTRARFAATASRMAVFNDARTEAIRARLRELLELSGQERALDVGTGTGPLALALAPYVHSVVGLDLVPEMLDEARHRAGGHENVTFVVGQAHDLPFASASFDIVLCGRTLHHVQRPDEVVIEMARVTKPGGYVLVIDQVASEDPEAANVHERIELLRDPAHVRTLSDGELRGLLEAAGLTIERVVLEAEERDLDSFLALAGCEGEPRRHVFEFVEEAVAAGRGGGIALRRVGSGFGFSITVGWYLTRRPQRSA